MQLHYFESGGSIVLIMQKQPPNVFCKKAAVKNFAIFTGKHLCWSFYLVKLWIFSCEYCAIFKNTYFEEQLSTAASNYDYFAVFRESVQYRVEETNYFE